MQKFLAVYIGTASALEKSKWNAMDASTRTQREQAGIKAWMEWGSTNQAAIVDGGAPLGKTKKISRDGITDISNTMAGYVIVEAESHEAAAKLFVDHPHFAIFPGDSVEIMPCLPIPGQ